MSLIRCCSTAPLLTRLHGHILLTTHSFPSSYYALLQLFITLSYAYGLFTTYHPIIQSSIIANIPDLPVDYDIC
jgi:hypothetical protein